MTTTTPATSRLNKILIDALVVCCCLLMTLYITRPWIEHPLTTSIGTDMPIVTGEHPYHFGNPDIIMNMAFAGWLKFSVQKLHAWPLAHTKYLMYPSGASQGTSFDGLLLAVLAALLWCVMPLELAYNLCLLLGVVLTGLAFYRLACRLWGRGLLAGALGFSAVCLPYFPQRLGCHPNLLYIWALPVAIHLFLNFDRKPTLKRALVWGLSLPLLALCSWHIFLLSLPFQGCATLFYFFRERRRGRDWTRLKRLALGWVLGMALVFVIGWPMIQESKYRQPITVDILASFATPLVQHFLPYPNSIVGQIPWVQRITFKVGTSWEGWTGGPLASILLLVLYCCWRRPRGARALIAAVAGLAVLIANGPFLHVTTAQPIMAGLKLPAYYLGKLWHGFNMIHVPGRMSLIVHFMALLATGFMIQTWRERFPRLRWVWPFVIVAIVSANVVCSLALNPYPSYPNLKVPKFYVDLGKEEGNHAVLDLPISAYWFPQYNYFQFWHGRPLASAAMFHDAIRDQEKEFLHNHPELLFFKDWNQPYASDRSFARLSNPRMMDYLAAHHIDYLIVHPDYIEFMLRMGAFAPQTKAYLERLETVWKDRLVYQDGKIRVYKTTKP